jgi:tripartite-type tricarboxylate transporter receptor subunit TctC
MNPSSAGALPSPVLPVFAQEFPSRPIAMVVPFSDGGPGDVIARLLGSSMSATLNRAIVMENVVGAGGTLGTNRLARPHPTATRVLLMHVGQAPPLYAKFPFFPACISGRKTMTLLRQMRCSSTH